MKTVVSVVVLCAVMTPMVAFGAANKIQKTSDGAYNVTYDYTDRAPSNWYMTARAELSFLNWSNKQYSNFDEDTGMPGAEKSDTEDFSFKPVFGGSFAVGRAFDYSWRVEFEAGYMGQFQESGNGLKFKLGIPYGIVNGFYDFSNGLYVGAGVGVAVPMTTIEGATLQGTNADHTGISPMGALMLGYAYDFNDRFTLDIRYRFAGMTGSEHRITWDVDTFYIKNKIDFIMDNSISVGLRYGF